MTKPSTTDWSSVQAPAKAEMPAQNRKSRLDGTPFVKWMSDSKAAGEARQLGPLANKAAVDDAVRLLRMAAAKLECGVRISVDERKRVVTFAAKDRKERRSPEERAAAKAERERRAKLTPEQRSAERKARAEARKASK